MAFKLGTYDVHSAARGPHWIAWLSQPGSQDPLRGVIIVGATQEEAEARAREWAAGSWN